MCMCVCMCVCIHMYVCAMRKQIVCVCLHIVCAYQCIQERERVVHVRKRSKCVRVCARTHVCVLVYVHVAA